MCIAKLKVGQNPFLGISLIFDKFIFGCSIKAGDILKMEETKYVVKGIPSIDEIFGNFDKGPDLNKPPIDILLDDGRACKLRCSP